MKAADPIVSQEINSAAAFGRQSAIFDELYSANAIVAYKRERVRAHILKYLMPGSHILELNSGTGEDALYFAALGHSVHATDISADMLRVLNGKVNAAGLNYMVTSEQCSFNNLQNLRQAGPYDAVFSNFGGLNCTGRLHEVLQSLPALLKAGGTATLVIISRFCLWEFLLLFRGKFKTATRRLFAKKGAGAHIEGEYFKCWYYGAGYVLKHTANAFEAVNIEGLCITVPPSYLEGFAEKYPNAYNWLKRREKKLKGSWPWRNMGDYFIITLQKK